MKELFGYKNDMLTIIKKPTTKKLFGGGWRKPITDEGNKWCNCIVPNLVSNKGIGPGTAYCLRCKCNWYH